MFQGHVADDEVRVPHVDSIVRTVRSDSNSVAVLKGAWYVRIRAGRTAGGRWQVRRQAGWQTGQARCAGQTGVVIQDLKPGGLWLGRSLVGARKHHLVALVDHDQRLAIGDLGRNVRVRICPKVRFGKKPEKRSVSDNQIRRLIDAHCNQNSS